MAGKLRRGFRTEAEDYAIEFRTELGLARHAPLAATALAELLGIPVKGISEIPDIDPAVLNYYRMAGNSEFSATSLCDGSYREIVHNDFQHANRQNSSIMHEIAHIILGHPPKPPLMEDNSQKL